MDLNTREREMLHFFCFRLLHDFKAENFNIPFIHFAFNDTDYSQIMEYLNDLKAQNHYVSISLPMHISNRSVMTKEIQATIDLMQEEHNNYKKNRSDDDIYIEIPDYKDFFNLLDQLMVAFEKQSSSNNFNTTALLRSLWLRMSPSDITDVTGFLRRQIEFIKNDYLFPLSDTNIQQIDDIYISYLNHGNADWFETNRHIRPFIKRKVGEMDDLFPGDKINLYKYYYLPVIHYGLIKEDGNPTCYIYGIQQLGKNEQDIVINNKIHEEKKRLRNKYISPDFLIALKIFIDILKTKGITTIKVPLMQVYNYDYHRLMGEKYRDKLASYSPERIHDLEWMNAPDYAIREYENLKKQYARFYQKEDIISANKSERLLHIFYLMAEKYANIDIISEPFFEGDCLICKIKFQKEKTL